MEVTRKLKRGSTDRGLALPTATHIILVSYDDELMPLLGGGGGVGGAFAVEGAWDFLGGDGDQSQK